MAEGFDNFQIVPAKDILTNIQDDKEINYDHVIIEGDLDIAEEIQSNEGKNVPYPSINSIKITNSRIEGKISFSGILIKGSADFQNTRFFREAVFSRTQFNMRAQFRDSIFNEGAIFHDARFCKEVIFSRAKFNKLARFSGSQFNGQAFFIESNFNCSILFIKSSFKDVVLFNRAKFMDKARFNRAKFEKDAAFNQSEFLESANFDGAYFGKLNNEMRKQGRALFIEAIFKNDVSFNGANFYSEAVFINSFFGGHALFRHASFGKLCDFKQVRFQNDADFNDVFFGKDAKFDLSGSKFNIIIVEWLKIQNTIVYDTQALISLIRSYDKLGWKNDANQCYYFYRKLNMSKMPFGFSKLVDISEYIVCGYGVRSINIIYVSGLIIWIFGIIYLITNGVCINRSCSYNCSPCSISIKESLLFSIIVFAAKIPTDLRAIGEYNWLASLESILGWLCLGIIMSAITKRIKL